MRYACGRCQSARREYAPSSSQVDIAEVRLADELAYRDRRRDERRQILGELTADAVDAGLYDAPAADYAEALRAARRRPAAG